MIGKGKEKKNKTETTGWLLDEVMHKVWTTSFLSPLQERSDTHSTADAFGVSMLCLVGFEQASVHT